MNMVVILKEMSLVKPDERESFFGELDEEMSQDTIVVLKLIGKNVDGRVACIPVNNIHIMIEVKEEAKEIDDGKNVS